MRKNKAIRILTATAMLAIALGGFSACNNDSHTHEYTRWAYDETQHWKVCEEDGAESEHVSHFFNAEDDYKCECGAQHTHTYEWKHNDEYHWQECSDGFKTRKEQHSFNDDGVCLCGETMAMTEVHGTLKVYDNGMLETDYTGIAFTLTEIESGTEVKINPALGTDGTYSFKIPQSEKAYMLTISKDEYISDSIAFDGSNGALRDAKLVYIAYATTPGMESWGTVDYSQLDKNIIRLDNDMQFIFSKKTYKQVAFSVTLQGSWNSTGADVDARQGVIFRFKEGNDYKGVISVQAVKDWGLWISRDNYATWDSNQDIFGKMAPVDGDFGELFLEFSNRPDLKEALKAGTLKLTMVRDGSMFYIYLNGEFFGFKQVDAKYADMESEVGFHYYNFEGSTIREWKFDNETDISAYTAPTFIKDKGAYCNNVILSDDVWQAMKVKLNSEHTGNIRISFRNHYGDYDGGEATSILLEDGNWKIQEMGSWNSSPLTDEFVNALEGDGLYIAYHRDVKTGIVKVYAGATKETLETAIATDAAIASFEWVELHQKTITSVGVVFDGGDYTASASGYSYGATSAEVLARL